MPYGKLIMTFSSPVPQKACTFGLSVHAFCGTGDENIIPTCREAGNYYIPAVPQYSFNIHIVIYASWLL